jgi:glucan phosphoethanolaminetransferase (alkaline phosphatase superfamily)
MNTPTALPTNPPHFVQRLIIIALASLFIFYHVTMLSDFVRWHDQTSDSLYNCVQAVLRVGIIVSLTLVVLGKRFALWTMWFSIGSLIVTHYWAHFGMVEADFTIGRHPLSYLKGLIMPSIITMAFLYRRR